jgi:hypothetical protein
MDREIVYLDRDNPIKLGLLTDGAIQDLSGVTHVLVVFSGVTFTSVGRTTWFDWTSGATLGRLSLKLGGVTGVNPGAYDMELIVFDNSNTDGVCWGTVPVFVRG